MDPGPYAQEPGESATGGPQPTVANAAAIVREAVAARIMRVLDAIARSMWPSYGCGTPVAVHVARVRMRAQLASHP